MNNIIIVVKVKNMIEIRTCISQDIHSNTFLIVDKETKEAAVIDPSREPSVFGVDLSDIKIKYVLLTHGHFDHMFKLDDYVREHGAAAYVHYLDEPLLSDATRNCSALFMPRGLVWNTPVRTFKDRDCFYLGDTEIKVMHTPGHTEGSVCFLCGDAMFCGDTLFYGSVGRTDFSGGSMPTLQRSLEKLKRIDKNYTVHTGHGSKTTLEREKKYNPYMLYSNI